MLDRSQKPWLTDPLYGGMSEYAARLSWEASQERRQRIEENFGDPRDDIPAAESAEEFGGLPDPAPDSDTGGADGPIPHDKALVAFPLIAFGNVRPDRERRGYLVKSLLSSTGLAVVWGPPKCGKSFWAMDLALHIAMGWEYRGHRVQQASVVYIALEGRHGIPDRFEAMRRHYDVDSAPLYLMTTALDLAKQADSLIASIQSQLDNTRPGVIVIDTLNRSLVGSESKDEDMARYLAAAGRIEEKFGCLVVIVHHCGIDASRPRGHTSLSGAVEVQIAVKKGDAGEILATVELAKDMPEGTEICSRLERIDLGTDIDGDPVSSLVVVPTEASAQPKQERKVRGAKKVALDTLRKAISEAGEVPPASNHIPPNTRTIRVATWRLYAYQGSITESDNPDSKQKAFVRAAKDLQAANLIGIWGDYAWLV
ncbi:MAG TPA: AAA family ATPase [Xanthobacteraceae bacterium]|jgi:hypothetical protein